MLKCSHGANIGRYKIGAMGRKGSAAAGTRREKAPGMMGSKASASQKRACNQSYKSVLRAGHWAVLCLMRWVVFEVLPLPMSARRSNIVGAACRLVGCAVSIGILSVELQASATAHGALLALLWVFSTLTAVLIGNIAREATFTLCLSAANLMGRAFHREGVTLSGRIFREIHYPTMTWARWESGVHEFSYEWTEATGRCNRIEVKHPASPGQTVESLRPLIRVITAPRMTSE